MYHNILIPTDGSEGTEKAVEQALDIAETYDATLHVLYVVDTAAFAPEVDVALIIDSLQAHGERAVADIEAQAVEEGVVVETTIETGSPHREILRYVEDNDIDLVVMGTHGRTGLGRYLLGSVAEKVVRSSPAPCLTVRMRDDD
ncbi:MULTISPECIES: universal stress protein [unclassified Haladaptatus]|uniref:universal stress protein n=1 Tax=unclassified Haladaptatus TaxID=2622732 RepID=UPI0023E762E2|nr:MULTISPECIES: universal stress protein [unclassified Haladaptatus]